MLSTLCYIERDGQYLMLLRNRKKKDINKGKWIGVGGHFLPGETPEECLLREVREETGLTLLNWQFRGIVTFQQNDDEAEYMHLFTSGLRRRGAFVDSEGQNLFFESVGGRPGVFGTSSSGCSVFHVLS